MPKVLSIGNVGLFLSALPRVHANVSGPCHEISSVGPIRHVVGYDTMKKFMSLS